MNGGPEEPFAAPAAVSPPGPALALVGYLFLLFGFAAVGFSSQSRDAISGLWLTEALAIALPAFIALRVANVRPAPYLGLRAPAALALLAALVLAVINQAPVTFLELAAQKLAPESWVKAFADKNHLLETIFANHKFGMVVTVVIAAPLGEELFFRGFALPALARGMGAPAAVVVSGLLFSLLHMDPVGFIGLWELGILFGVLRWATGSIWPAVLAHATNNGLAAAAFLLGMQKPEEVPPSWLVWCGGLLLVVFVPLAARYLMRPSPAAAREERWSLEGPGGFRLARAWPLLAVWAVSVAAGLAYLWPLVRRLAS